MRALPRRPRRRAAFRGAAFRGAAFHRVMFRRAVLLPLAGVIALAAAGCGSSGSPSPTTGSPTPAPSATPTSTPAVGSPSAIADRAASIDPSLLAVLPASVSGQLIVESPDAEKADVAEIGITADVDRLAVGFVALPGSSASGGATGSEGDLATATVVALQPGVAGDTFYADWRKSFDDAVCAQAGSLTASSEQSIGGRPVWVGTCSGGVTTYQVLVASRNLIVSVMSIGSRDFGRQIVTGLRL